MQDEVLPVHGCGPNPLVLLLSEMPTWFQRTLALTSNGDMMRTIRSDENIRRKGKVKKYQKGLEMIHFFREFLEFKRIVRRFKDCIKTGDGVRAKKSRYPQLSYLGNAV